MSSPAFVPAIVPPPAPGDDAPRCPNCGTVAARNFCPECGQECISLRLSLRDLAHEFLDDHVGWSTKVPRTMARLLFRPGALTRDFIDGRRVRYLSPLRLYLSLSVIFFLVVASPPKWAVHTARTTTTTNTDGAFHFNAGRVDVTSAAADSETAAAAAARMAKADTLAASYARRPPDTTTVRGRIKALVLARNVAIIRMSAKERNERFFGGLAHLMPNVMFVLLPLFAFYLKLLYWRRRRFYAEHVVFALHVHAVAYATLTLIILLPWRRARDVLLLACIVYFVIALRRVYGGGLGKTIGKSLVLGATYVTSIAVAATALGAFLFLFG